jgi:hypothetical protein
MDNVGKRTGGWARRALAATWLAAAWAAFGTTGEAWAEPLDGFAGVEFGRVMPEDEPHTVNEDGFLVYEFEPDGENLGMYDWSLIATPVTRRVFQIRAAQATLVMFPGDAKSVDEQFTRIMRTLESKYGRPMQSDRNGQVRSLLFDDEFILLVRENQSVIQFGAFCHRINEEAKREAVEAELLRIAAEDRTYSKELRVLDLRPALREGQAELERLESVFGIEFDKPFPPYGTQTPEHRPDGSWVYDFTPAAPFLDFQTYSVQASPVGREIYLVSCAAEVGNEDAARQKFNLLKRMIERATGREFAEGTLFFKTSSPQDESLVLRIGEQKTDTAVQLVYHWQDDSVVLGFLHLGTMRKALAEMKSLP